MNDEIIFEEGSSFDYYIDPILEEVKEEDREASQEDDIEVIQEEDQILNVLNEINEKIGDLENVSRDPEPVQVVVSSDSIPVKYVRNNDSLSLSENIINKPLNNYTVSESLLAFVVVAVFVAGLSYVIKRSVFRWN